jgi:hypothetical protein
VANTGAHPELPAAAGAAAGIHLDTGLERATLVRISGAGGPLR